MTPDYSSPEQIRGESLTTAGDVYSLGVVLFELLTGSHPYSTKGLSLSQLEQLVCAGNRSKPCETTGLPNRVARELRGDLDNIVLKAMRTEPERRYKSAEQLAEDLSNWAKAWEAAAPSDPLRRQFLAYGFTGMADIEGRLGQLRDAVADYRGALAVLEPIDAGSPERAKYTVGTGYNSLGGALTQTGPLPAPLTLIAPRQRFARTLSSNIRPIWVTRDGS